MKVRQSPAGSWCWRLVYTLSRPHLARSVSVNRARYEIGVAAAWRHCAVSKFYSKNGHFHSTENHFFSVFMIWVVLDVTRGVLASHTGGFGTGLGVRVECACGTDGWGAATAERNPQSKCVWVLFGVFACSIQSSCTPPHSAWSLSLIHTPLQAIPAPLANPTLPVNRVPTSATTTAPLICTGSARPAGDRSLLNSANRAPPVVFSTAWNDSTRHSFAPAWLAKSL